MWSTPAILLIYLLLLLNLVLVFLQEKHMTKIIYGKHLVIYHLLQNTNPPGMFAESGHVDSIILASVSR